MPADNLSANLPPPVADPPKAELQPLQAELERALVSAVPREKLPTVRQAVAAYVHQVEEHYSGPLPHPRHLEYFERTLPGAANRILVMAEQEQFHRHAWERAELSSSVLTERMGLFGGIAVAIGLIIGAVICAYFGERVIGGALVAASAVSIVPAIIQGRERLRSEQPAKNAASAPVRRQPAKKRGR